MILSFGRKVLLLFCLCVSLALAASQQVVTYGYDRAGNLISMSSEVNVSVPVISSISPAFINRGRATQYTATGNNLSGAVE